MQAIVQSVVKFAGDAAVQGMRRGIARYGPQVAATGATATKLFMIAADDSRQFKRDAAIALEWPLSAEEYDALEDGSWKAEPRTVRVCCQTIRGSREAYNATGINSPIPLFSHWRLEVGDVCYELREYTPARQLDQEKRQGREGREKLYEEVGLESRKIKLEVTKNPSSHPSSKYYDVGVTNLDEEKIIELASLIFRRFGTGYDLFVDNCQHFTQLLSEAICGRENREAVRKFFDQRSVMKFPVAASWLVAPVYGCTKALHYGLEDVDNLQRPVGQFLEKMENFYLHPRVYAARNKDFFLF